MWDEREWKSLKMHRSNRNKDGGVEKLTVDTEEQSEIEKQESEGSS